MMRVSLARNSPQFIRECAVDVAAVLGFRSVSMEFPVLWLDAGAMATGAVADAMGADAEFASLNAEWRDRFEKYAHAWMPRLFPAEYYKDVIFYWVPYPYKPDYYYVAVRFPWVTAVSFVSGVADETATGDYLALCARAHLDEDLAIIKLLSEAKVQLDESVWMEGDAVCARRVRTRPLDLPVA